MSARAVGVIVVGAIATGAAAFEVIPPGEGEQIRATATIMTDLQTRRAETVDEQRHQLLRGVHPKSHGCVRAEFTVDEKIAETYRLGLFATPGKRFDAWVRYSNAAALREDDLKRGPGDAERKNGSRGMALKILDVEGEILGLDGGRKNQDFLMINTPEFAFPDVRAYKRLNEALLTSPMGDSAAGFFQRLGQPDGPDFTADDRRATLRSLGIIQNKIEAKERTVRNPLQVQYFGAAPFGFGPDRAMKVSAKPCKAVPQPDFASRTDPADPSVNYLRHALTASMRGTEEACFDFQIQTRVRAELGDDEEQRVAAIEDATTLWPDELARYETVARITIPVPQAPDSAAAIAHCERLAFTPFHALAAHRPIGGINRLRELVYERSAAHRGAGVEEAAAGPQPVSAAAAGP